jgi:glycosyltransferase involved in cell wall biosynthesis
MHILLLVDYYLPGTTSCAKLTHDLATELVRQGHEVLLITAVDVAPRHMTVERSGGLTVARVRTGPIKGAPLPLRALHEIGMPHLIWWCARHLLRAQRIDLVVYYSPSIFWGPLVRRVKELWGCPSYLILRDIFPKWARDCGVMRDGLAFRFFQREAICQYDQADTIGVESEGNVRYFQTELPHKHYNVEVLNNWAALDEGKIESGEYREKFGWEDKVVFFYGGNMGFAQGVDTILDLIRAMRPHTEVRFLLVGQGAEISRIQSVIASEHLDNVVLHPAVDQRTYLAMLSEADVGFLSLARELQTHNVPSKALPYMYFSLPILASLNPGNDLASIVHTYEAGVCVETGDLPALVEAAVRLAKDPNLRRRLGANSRRLLETRFSASSAAKQITELRPFRSASVKRGAE